MIKYLIEDPSNHDLLISFLKVSKDTNTEHRKSFLVTLEELFAVSSKGIEPRLSDILQMMFSNLTTPAQFPESFGLIGSSINYLILIANTPFENEEILILTLLK